MQACDADQSLCDTRGRKEGKIGGETQTHTHSFMCVKPWKERCLQKRKGTDQKRDEVMKEAAGMTPGRGGGTIGATRPYCSVHYLYGNMGMFSFHGHPPSFRLSDRCKHPPTHSDTHTVNCHNLSFASAGQVKLYNLEICCHTAPRSFTFLP